MRDARRVQPRDLLPEVAQHVVADLAGVEVLEHGDVGLHGHDDRVALGPERRRDDVRDTEPVEPTFGSDGAAHWRFRAARATLPAGA